MDRLDLVDLIRSRIGADGPLRFDDFVDLALYDPEHGFYTGGRGAGRRRDFLTSPEVGPLFGAVLARALDRWWTDAGRPEPWRVVDAGAGPGSLLTSVAGAEPAGAAAWRLVAVDRAGADDPATVPDLPTGPFEGVVLANELLDNVPWRLLEHRSDGWAEVWVTRGPDGDLAEVLRPAGQAIASRAASLAPDATPGARVPIQERAAAWLTDALDRLGRGRVVVIDYGSTTAGLADRPWREWVRTYREHQRGRDPLTDVGDQDITVEVAFDQLAAVRPPAEDRSQADFLRAHGLDDLVAEGRRVWEERAHLGDLEALRGRSRVSEAEALTDPGGLGAFRVLEWVVRPDR